MDLFGGGSRRAKKGKKKKKEENRKQQNLNVNPLKDCKIVSYFMQGYGPKKTECQDSLCQLERFAEDCHFFAVYDGHGSSGKEASQAANDYIQTYLEKNSKKIKTLVTDKNRESFLRNAFKTAESKLKGSGIDYSNSGTCAISIFIQKNIAYIANLGDSRAVLCRLTSKEKLAIELSWDHKPTRPDEKDRILRSGGKIEKLIIDGNPVGPYRVWADDEGPGIAMTRTLGDLQAKKIGLISEPELQHIELISGDQFIVIGSDGIWDMMTSAEVVGFVLQCPTRELAAENLVKEARRRWDEANKTKKANSKIGDLPYLKNGCDDITAVIGFFTFIEEEGDQYKPAPSKERSMQGKQ